MLIASAGHTQTSNRDTVCPYTDDALRVLAAAKNAKVLAERVAAYESDIVQYNIKINALEAAIVTYKKDSVANAEIIASHERDKSNLIIQRDEKEAELVEARKIIKKLNRKVKWTAGFGLAGIVGMGFLYLTK